MVEHTMNNPSELQMFDEQVKTNKKLVDAASALERLQSNRDFRKLIMEGYLQNEAVRLVHLKADPEYQTSVKQDAIIRDIDAIGSLNGFLNITLQQGRIAVKQLADADETRVYLEQKEKDGE